MLEYPYLLTVYKFTVFHDEVIAVVVMFKHLREVPHLLVINLAVSDLGVMLMSGLELIGVFYGDTFLPKYPLLCEFSGVLCMSCCFASLWTMMFIAINRHGGSRNLFKILTFVLFCFVLFCFVGV